MMRHREKKPGFSGLVVGGQQEPEDGGPCVFNDSVSRLILMKPDEDSRDQFLGPSV